MRLALTVILICLPLPALAWGAEGHEIVAAIALRELTPAARLQVARLLGSEAMLVHDSNWADEVRDQRPDTGPWHYVDIPLDAPGYDAGRDCGGDACVVAQISHDLHVLGNARVSAGQRAEALRFLVHFVADIHQPLHAVDNADKGGNGVRVYLRGDAHQHASCLGCRGRSKPGLGCRRHRERHRGARFRGPEESLAKRCAGRMGQ